MRRSFFASKANSLLAAVSTAGVLMLGPVGASNAASLPDAAPQNNQDDVLMIAYENACAEDELVAGDEVTVNGETYTLEEDEDGLFMEYGDAGSYSVVSFDADCETVSFQQIDGTDTIVAEDEDEGEEVAEDDVEDEEEVAEDEEFEEEVAEDEEFEEEAAEDEEFEEEVAEDEEFEEEASEDYEDEGEDVAEEDSGEVE
jgi:hypothetical protein